MRARWRVGGGRSSTPTTRCDRDARGRKHSLAAYLPLVGYDLPPEYAGGRVGKTIGALRDALEVEGSYDAVRPKLQARWLEVLGHNEHDLRATRAVCLAALDESGGPGTAGPTRAEEAWQEVCAPRSRLTEPAVGPCPAASVSLGIAPRSS